MTTRAIVIAGATSGVGKTTIATGLMGVLSRRGLKVQPFKTGPDYIDPTYHTSVTSVASHNLDTYMLSPAAVTELFQRAMQRKDIAIIEGVMGLYDGRTGTGEEGSTAELAKFLKVPVILVIDSRKGARSMAALVTGYRDFDPALHLSGVILNGIGSDRHLKVCREAIEFYTGVPVVGYLPRNEDLVLPERHLGLVPTVEGKTDAATLERIIAQCEATLDIPAILTAAGSFSPQQSESVLFPPEKLPPVVRIAVARDRAFTFYYQDSLDMLEAWGAELVPFSPLDDGHLPENIAGIYIGGGFPELYARELAENSHMRHAIRDASQSGMPVYAECGGMMYLGHSTGDFEGSFYEMAGIFPFVTRIGNPKLSLGYRTVTALQDGPLLSRGETVNGHEFHWSVLDTSSEETNAYQLTGRENRIEGFQKRNTLASYIHLHMGSNPGMAQHMIQTCRCFTRVSDGGALL